MPEYVSVGTAGEQQLPPGEWVTVYWDREYSDPSRQHRDSGGLSVLVGPAMYALAAALKIQGLSAGAAGQIRTVEVLADDTAQYEPGPVQEFSALDGDTEVLYGVPADAIGGDRWLRVQVIQYGSGTASLNGGSSAKVLFWR